MLIAPDDPLRRLAVPLQPKPFRLVVGTRPAQQWLLPGADGAHQLGVKRELLRRRTADVLRVMPTAHAGVAAMVEMLTSERQSDNPPRGAHGWPKGIDVDVKLAAAAGDVQEDLCLMQYQRGHWRLTAGCVCFPSHWRLADKLDGGLGAIHEPVPGYAERLALATAKAFDRVAAGTDLVERFNWSLTDSTELFAPWPSEPRGVAVREVPELIWLRTERQTLRPLPRGLGVVFTIRTFLTPLRDFTEVERRALGESLRGMSDELAEYRSSLGYRDSVLEWAAER